MIMGKRTTLFEQHQLLGGKIVDFAGWEMPLHYGSQLEEHQQVRQQAGIFDVSHMNIVDIHGDSAKEFLRYILSNDIAKLAYPGKALYTCMLNPQGGVIDDLIVYYQAPKQYRLVMNAGTREKDIAWIKQQAQSFSVEIKPCEEFAIIALQGPTALQIADNIFQRVIDTSISSLKPFHFVNYADGMIARTGYTGEEGIEIIVASDKAVSLWQTLLQHGAKPIGLGARDTLRLEAGYNLYGSDMDETTTPLESNLSWTVAFEPAERQFIGRNALINQKQQGNHKQFIGLVLSERGVLRHEQIVFVNQQPIGKITSGSFSPTLGLSIAMARIELSPGKTIENSNDCYVDIRGKHLPVRVTKPAFVRLGKSLIA